jgi:hypothetical protein
MPGSTVPNALASALGNVPPSSDHANVSLLALQQLERAQAEDASRRLATAVPPVETLRRMTVARAEQDRRLASLYPAAALQQLEREENRLVVLQQLELARAEEESRQASLSYVAALRRLELARIHTGSRLEDVSPLGSLQHQLELAQDREGSQPSALDILRHRQLEQHVQELRRRTQSTSSQTMQPGLHSTASLPPATVTSLLEGIASVAAGQQQQHHSSQPTPGQTMGQTAPSFQMGGDPTVAFLPAPSDFGRAIAGQAEPGATHHLDAVQLPSARQAAASGDNQSSPGSSSTSEQDRKPRARP